MMTELPQGTWGPWGATEACRGGNTMQELNGGRTRGVRNGGGGREHPRPRTHTPAMQRGRGPCVSGGRMENETDEGLGSNHDGAAVVVVDMEPSSNPAFLRACCVLEKWTVWKKPSRLGKKDIKNSGEI